MFVYGQNILNRLRAIREEVDTISTIIENKSYPTDDNRCDYLYSELDTLVATLDLLEARKYKESYIVIRTVLEKFLYFWLMMEGRKYRLNSTFHIRPSAGSTAKLARDKTTDLWKKQKDLGNPDYKDILNIQKSSRHDDEIMVTFEPEGLFEQHDVSQTGPLIPNYNYMLEEYNPELAHTSDIITVDESLVSPDVLSKVAKAQKQIYHNYFYIDNIIRNLEICNLVDDFKCGIIRIHYSFLSKFVHPSIESIELRRYKRELNFGKYGEDAYIELIILYISKLMQLLLNTFLQHYKSNSNMPDYFKYKKLIDELKLLSEKLWFIDDNPTQFDKNAIDTYVTVQKSLGRAVSNGLVYYRNPLARLRNMNA